MNKQQCIDLLTQNAHAQLFDVLTVYLDQQEKGEILSDELILLKTRHNDFLQDELRGILSNEQVKLEQARINNLCLELINKAYALPQSDRSSSFLDRIQYLIPQISRFKWIGIMVLVGCWFFLLIWGNATKKRSTLYLEGETDFIRFQLAKDWRFNESLPLRSLAVEKAQLALPGKKEQAQKAVEFEARGTSIQFFEGFQFSTGTEVILLLESGEFMARAKGESIKGSFMIKEGTLFVEEWEIEQAFSQDNGTPNPFIKFSTPEGAPIYFELCEDCSFETENLSISECSFAFTPNAVDLSDIRSYLSKGKVFMPGMEDTLALEPGDFIRPQFRDRATMRLEISANTIRFRMEGEAQGLDHGKSTNSLHSMLPSRFSYYFSESTILFFLMAFLFFLLNLSLILLLFKK